MVATNVLLQRPAIAGLALRQIIFAGILALGFTRAVAANPSPEWLISGNSSVSIDTVSLGGMTSWTVDGFNVMQLQTFAFQIGGSNSPVNIATLSNPAVTRPNDEILQVTYTNRQISIDFFYSLLGGTPNSGTSDVGEQIRIRNLTGGALDFHFFQFSTFNAVQHTMIGTGLTGRPNEALVDGAWGRVDTVIAPGASMGQIDGGPTWGFRWDQVLATGGALLLSEDMNAGGVIPVPEPSLWPLVPIALAAHLIRRRSRTAVPERPA